MHNESSAPSWQDRVVNAAVKGLPFYYGMLWGCFFAVFFGAVEPSGEALKGFAAFASALTGAGLGIWGARSVSERNAMRERRRAAYADLLAVQSAVRALIELQLALSAVEKMPGPTIGEKIEQLDREQYARLMTTMVAITGQYEDVPKFNDCIGTDTDHAKAHRIREVFMFMERMFRPFKDTTNTTTALKAQATILLHPNTKEGLERMRAALLENGGYFRKKLGVDK